MTSDSVNSGVVYSYEAENPNPGSDTSQAALESFLRFHKDKGVVIDFPDRSPGAASKARKKRYWNKVTNAWEDLQSGEPLSRMVDNGGNYFSLDKTDGIMWLSRVTDSLIKVAGAGNTPSKVQEKVILDAREFNVTGGLIFQRKNKPGDPPVDRAAEVYFATFSR